MRLSETVKLDPTRRSENELRLMGDRVSRLFNAANYRLRQSFFAKQGVPHGAALETLMKDEPEYRQLPSDVAQETVKKLSEAWRSYFKLRAKWTKDPQQSQKPGLPSYRKDRKTGQRPFDYIPVKHSRSYSLDPKDAHIVLPRDRRPRKTGSSGRLHVAYRGRRRFQGKMGRAEVCYDRVRKRWYLSWSVEAEAPKPLVSGRCAAVDLGVRITASLSVEGLAKALHFEGRETLKDWDHVGRLIAREQACIAGTRGGDPERCPSSRVISRCYKKRKERLDHALRCMAKATAEVCEQHGVGTVYLGWPKGILRDVFYGSSRWAGRIHNFWLFGRSLELIEQALAQRGIVAVRVGERGSSSGCPSCGSEDVVRHPRWLLRCKACGERIHSDQAGSRNILRQNKPSVSWAGLEASPRTETRRWNRHGWETRSANPKRWGNDLPEFLKTAA